MQYVKRVICLGCNCEFTARLRPRYCTRKCYARSWARKKRGTPLLETRACIICGAGYIPSCWHYKKQQTCSNKCSRRAEYLRHRAGYVARAKHWQRANSERYKVILKGVHARYPERYRAIHRNRDAVRRARMGAVHTAKISAADWLALCRRQQGRCWWCGNVAKLERDHVIPISKGGNHVLANLVGACTRCNSSKRDQLWPKESGAGARVRACP